MNITQKDNNQLQENNIDNTNISQNIYYQSNIYEQKDNNNININKDTTRNEYEYSQEKENDKINKNEIKEKDINNKDNFEKKEHTFYTPNTFGDRKIELSFNYTEAIQELKRKNVNETIFNSLPKNKLSFAMCSIGKLENLYVRDFIIYYLELGVDKFYIYDNNEINGEKFEDVIQDFIDKNYVEIINMRGNQNDSPQINAYESCYQDHKNNYDWFLFFDFDEYLYIKDYSLNDFVQLPMFNNCASIIYYYMYYTDNNEVYYNTESPIKRFTVQLERKISGMNDQNSMSRGRINELTYKRSPHAPFFINGTYNTKYITCNTEGNIFHKFEENQQNKNIKTYKNAFVKHFHWRSTEEYCIKIGIRKYFKSYNWDKRNYNFLKGQYFIYNANTDEKRSLFRKFFL